MNYENLIVNLENGVLTITINRPKQMNALNKNTIAELEKAIIYAEQSEDVKAIILTGAGDKSFVAGADIKEFADFDLEQGKQLAQNGQRVFMMFETCSKPVIAAVNGFALGGGCELAMACHIRVASENARFSQPEVNLGLIPGYGGTQRLTQLIGKSKAFEFLMTGEMIDASLAKQLGLVNYVATSKELIDKAKLVIKKILFKSPKAITGVINSVNAYYTDGVDGYKVEIDEFSKCFSTEDFKEGTSAFMKKRRPKFTGK